RRRPATPLSSPITYTTLFGSDHITLYDSTTTNGAVWRYNGSVITPGGAAAGGYSFAYANRGLLTYTVGTGSNDFVFDAFDKAGAVSPDATWTITGTSSNNPPSETVLATSTNATRTGSTGTQLVLACRSQGVSDLNHIT